MTALTVPDISDDADALTAAFAYANAGWYVLPIKHGTKHPGSVVGKDWQRKSTRDPEQIVAIWAGTNHGIALHCGRSGAVVLDVDRPDNLPDVLFRHVNAAPHQTTRPDTPGRGHYVFATPVGRTLGNGTGKLGGAWGEVRGANGVIVVAPSHHPDGGEYRWQRIGLVPELPCEVADQLPDADRGGETDAATDAQVSLFLRAHATATKPGLLGAVILKLRGHIDRGDSRHDSLVAVLPWAMEEARAGLYSAKDASNKLAAIFIEAVTQPGEGQRTQASAVAEFDSIRSWAIGRAMAANMDARKARADNTVDIFDAALAKKEQVTEDNTATVSLAPVEETKPADDFGGLSIISMSEVRSEAPAWGWEFDDGGRILKGGLTLFAGRPSAGKSTTARWFAAGWSNGTIAGCWEGKPVNVLYVATEEAWNHAVKPSLQAAGADAERTKFIKRDGEPTRVAAVNDEANLVRLLQAYEVRVIVLDPLMSSLAPGTNTDKSSEVRESLEAWGRIAEAIDGLVLGIVHLIKSPKGGDVLAAINGSSAFGEVARCAFGFAVDNEAEDGSRVMSQVKNSSGVSDLNLAYKVGTHPVKLDDGKTAEVARFELIGPTDRTVRELLLEEGNSRHESGSSRCSKWLKGFLTQRGATEREEVVAAAAEFGFSTRMLRSAATDVGVITERTRTMPSRSLWSLEAGTDAA